MSICEYMNDYLAVRNRTGLGCLVIILTILGVTVGLLLGLNSCASLPETIVKDQKSTTASLHGITRITGLTTEETDNAVLVAITADRPFSYEIANSQEAPVHLRIDFESAEFPDLPPKLTINKGLVESIEVIPGGGGKKGGRIELSLKEKVDYEVNKKANRLVIAVPKGQEQASLPEEQLSKIGGSVPQTPAPASLSSHATLSAARAQDYAIGGKDVLEITVYDEPDLTKLLRVSRLGTISFPLVGTVRVEGLNPSQLELKLKELLAQGYLKNPQVNVMVKEYKSKEVSVVGGIRKPGIYPLTSPTTVLEMISLAGGMGGEGDSRGGSGRAGKELILLRHEFQAGSSQSQDEIKYIRIDLERLLDKGDMSLNLLLMADDTLYVPQAGAVYVFGEVKAPGTYDLTKKTTSLVEAINMAGGFTERASSGGVKVIRIEGGQEKTLKVNVSKIISKGKMSDDIPLRDGDVIVVPESFF